MQLSQDKNIGEQSDSRKKSSFIALVFSTLAAAFGVQSRKNLEQDFQQSSPLPFIVAGILFTLLFLASLIVIAVLVVE